MITSSALIAAIVLLIFTSLFFRKAKNYPPGPFRWPVIGNLFLLRKLSRKFGGQQYAFVELSRQYDSDVVALSIGSSDVVVVSGQKGIKTVLHSQEYDGRPWNEFIKLRNLGSKNGITMADGTKWREMRAWVVRKLRMTGLGRRPMSDLMINELTELLKTIGDGGIHCLIPIITPAVINVLWNLVTGKRFTDKHRLQYFMDLMKRRSEAFDMTGGVLSTLPWIRHIAPESSGYNLLVTVNNELKAFLMATDFMVCKYIIQCNSEIKCGKDCSLKIYPGRLEETINDHKKNYVEGMQDDLIYMFLNEMYSNHSSSENFTDDQLVMILIDLFIAGLVTTSTTLDFLFLNMVINQDVQKRLHEEIDKVLGNGKTPDLGDKSRMPYAEAIITESQRMCLATPIIGPRRVIQETNLLGYTIPKETTVFMNLWSILMDPHLYPEPESFKPERFFKNGLYVSDDKLILFGEGKRRCPGETLAQCGLFLLFIGVMQQYNLLPVPGQEPPKLIRIPGLTISPKPYDVLLTPRQAVRPFLDVLN